MLIPRAILSGLIAVAGLSLLAYGLAAHTMPVLVEQEITPPPQAEPEPTREPDVPASPFFAQPPPPTPPEPEKVLVAISQPERRLIRDVTVGGLTRLNNGQIKRTYSGDGPALCPT
jgi:hypothetical protein